MQLNVAIHDQAVQTLLNRLAQRVADMRPALQEIGLRYERSVLENFRAEKAPDGSPWTPNAPATLLARQRRAKSKKAKQNAVANKKILVDTGALYGGVHSQASGNSVTIGVGGHIPYARIHQFGGRAGRGRKVTLPARPYLALNRGGSLELADKDRTMIIEVLRRHLHE